MSKASVRVVSSKQAKAVKTLFDTLSTIEADFYDKKLGPVQVSNRTSAKTGSLRDFTMIRNTIDQCCHAGMKYDLALAGIKEIPQRYQKCVVDPESTKKNDVTANRWAATRQRIREVYRNEQVAKLVIRNLHQLLIVLKIDVRDVIAAFEDKEAKMLPPDMVISTADKGFKFWEPEQPESYKLALKELRELEARK